MTHLVFQKKIVEYSFKSLNKKKTKKLSILYFLLISRKKIETKAFLIKLKNDQINKKIMFQLDYYHLCIDNLKQNLEEEEEKQRNLKDK